MNFVREGCGEDKICQSNLQLTYQFGTRAPISNVFTPLPRYLLTHIYIECIIKDSPHSLHEFIVFRDEWDTPVFSLSDQRSIMLEVTVANVPSNPENPQEDGDDAHAAQLLVSLPDTLSYSGSMGQQVDAQHSHMCVTSVMCYIHLRCVLSVVRFCVKPIRTALKRCVNWAIL